MATTTMNTTSSMREIPALRRRISEDIPCLCSDLDGLGAHGHGDRGTRLAQTVERERRAACTQGNAGWRIEHDRVACRQVAHRCAADETDRRGRVAERKLACADHDEDSCALRDS